LASKKTTWSESNSPEEEAATLEAQKETAEGRPESQPFQVLFVGKNVLREVDFPMIVDCSSDKAAKKPVTS